MKKIKLKESTLKRVVERVVLEQQREELQKQLQDAFAELAKDPDNEDLKTKIAELSKKLGLKLTKTGQEELKEYLK